MSKTTQDSYGTIIELMREEQGIIQGELKTIGQREPYLKEMEKRLEGSLRMFDDMEYLPTTRMSEEPKNLAIAGVPKSSYYKPRQKQKLSGDIMLPIALFIKRKDRPVKGSEIYDYLLKSQLIEPLDSNDPGKAFSRILNFSNPTFIVYEKMIARWKLPNPRKDARSSHLFVQIISKIFRDNNQEFSSMELFGKLKEYPSEKELIEEYTKDYNKFVEQLRNYREFFNYEESNNMWCLLEFGNKL